jgi:hypothetical protein
MVLGAMPRPIGVQRQVQSEGARTYRGGLGGWTRAEAIHVGAEHHHEVRTGKIGRHDISLELGDARRQRSEVTCELLATAGRGWAVCLAQTPAQR